jgi:hypothetical protein
MLAAGLLSSRSDSVEHTVMISPARRGGFARVVIAGDRRSILTSLVAVRRVARLDATVLPVAERPQKRP